MKCDSASTTVHGMKLSFGSNDSRFATQDSRYHVCLDDRSISCSADLYRMRIYYNWLLSGSKPSSDPCAKSWLQLALGTKAQHPEALQVIKFVEWFCCQCLYPDHEENSLQIIEAHIETYISQGC